MKTPTDAKAKQGEVEQEDEDEEDEDEEDEEAEEEEEEEESSFDGGNLSVREMIWMVWSCFGYTSWLGFEIPLRMPYL